MQTVVATREKRKEREEDVIGRGDLMIGVGCLVFAVAEEDVNDRCDIMIGVPDLLR
jgi:hypothetical protein